MQRTKAANKLLLLATTVYNLKKWLRFTTPNIISKTAQMMPPGYKKGFGLIKNLLLLFIPRPIRARIFFHQSLCFVKNQK